MNRVRGTSGAAHNQDVEAFGRTWIALVARLPRRPEGWRRTVGYFLSAGLSLRELEVYVSAAADRCAADGVWLYFCKTAHNQIRGMRLEAEGAADFADAQVARVGAAASPALEVLQAAWCVALGVPSLETLIDVCAYQVGVHLSAELRAILGEKLACLPLEFTAPESDGLTSCVSDWSDVRLEMLSVADDADDEYDPDNWRRQFTDAQADDATACMRVLDAFMGLRPVGTPSTPATTLTLAVASHSTLLTIHTLASAVGTALLFGLPLPVDWNGVCQLGHLRECAEAVAMVRTGKASARDWPVSRPGWGPGAFDLWEVAERWALTGNAHSFPEQAGAATLRQQCQHALDCLIEQCADLLDGDQLVAEREAREAASREATQSILTRLRAREL